MSEAQNYLPEEVLEQLPSLYETEDIRLEDKVLQVKYFTPDSNWAWYGVEYDPKEEIFFGYVEGIEREWGYFTLSQIKSVRGALGLPVERDLYFEPIVFSELMKGGKVHG